MNDRICNKCGASFSTGRCCSNPVIDVSQIQREVHAWSVRNFGMPDDSINPLLGVIEEAGEICHAVLKSRQRIRGFHDVEKRRAAVKDGVGDLLVYLCAFAELENLDLAETLAEVWSQVKQRDWKSGANVPAGHVRVEDDNAGSTVAQD